MGDFDMARAYVKAPFFILVLGVHEASAERSFLAEPSFSFASKKERC
jgi:hypothetical protein